MNTPGREHFHKPLGTSMQRIAVTLLLPVLVLIVTACTPRSDANSKGDPTATPAITPLPTSTTPSAGWTREPTPPLMDQVWQPPEPTKHAEFSMPTETLSAPDAMITYEVAALGPGANMKITKDGQVTAFGYRETSWTLTLSPERLAVLLALFDKADFFNLNDGYIEQDPPGVFSEMAYVTVTYNKSDRSKSVQTRGDSLTPSALIEIESTLAKLENEVRDTGTVSKRPDALVDYMLLGGDHSWSFDVDVEGGLYLGSGHVDARLTPEDLEALNGALADMSKLPNDKWYMPPSDVRDILFMSEKRVIVVAYKDGVQTQELQAFSGASVPPEYQVVLQKLAEIYDKYAPEQ